MIREPGRVMALDVGERRIGVAVSDTTQLLATPLITIPAMHRSRAIIRINTLIHEHEVVELVVGLPLTLSGEVGPQAKTIQDFVKELQLTISIPIHLFDERLTTVAAERMMVDLGIKPERRRLRIDEVAASIILQDFLDRQRAQKSP